MRQFSSYGPIDTELHYYVPRTALIEHILTQLKGNSPEKGGHYLTVWGPRQTGKTWIMRETFLQLKQDHRFETIVLNLQHLRTTREIDSLAQMLAQKLLAPLSINHLKIKKLGEFEHIFRTSTLSKPLILILDEFDALSEEAMSGLVEIFRDIYMSRQYQIDLPTAEKDYLLHGLALIGVRAVLGVENVTGSPFNVQRSVHIPNLTSAEVTALFDQYQLESGQLITSEVVARIWNEFLGQPGLTCWFGELLTETYNQNPEQPITQEHFENVYAAALDLLPNNNILNIISKAKQPPYQSLVLELFKTTDKIKFTYDDSLINFLYLNGVVDIEPVSWRENYVKFSCPFVQKRLFNYFARELFRDLGQLYAPFEDLSDTITEDSLNVLKLLQRYEHYLQTNRHWLLTEVPRRQSDLRVYEAVFHFNLYLYLTSFLRSYEGQVQPEFPTGNGQIDLLIRYAGQLFGLEIKSFANQREYRKALTQASKYGQQLGLTEIWLVLFIEAVDEVNRQKFEVDYLDPSSGVTVHPLFMQTGSLLD